MSITDDGQYGDKQIRFLEAIWGEGFLSPGGVTEIDLVLEGIDCLLYTSPSPRDRNVSRMPSSA